MTLYPRAQYRPLGTEKQPRLRTHDIICLHTMVGNLYSTDRMFKVGGYTGLEAHFGVGGKWSLDATHGLDGVVYQWQDTEYTADANLDGNWHIVSIETGDNAPQSASDIAPWTPAQLSSIVNLVAWLCLTYNIPAKLIPDTKVGHRGIAYHRQGVEPSTGAGTKAGYLVKGGELWSSAVGKACPGEARITQLKDVVIPRVQAVLNPPKPTPPTPKPQVIDMQWTDKIALTETDAKVWGNRLPGVPYKAGDMVTVGDMIRYPTLARETDAKVDNLTKLITTFVTQPKEDTK